MTPLAGARLTIAFTALMFVNAMSSVDATIVATAAPTITAELGRLSLLPWISTAYLLAQIATIPLYGKLGDVYGRRRFLLLAAALFLVASMCCGLAQTMPQLVAFRAVQGAGAGGLAGLSMALVADIAPPAKLGRYLGYAGLVYALTFVLGPLSGGLFVDHLSWRWAFFINLPAGLLGGSVVLALDPQRRVRPPSPDRRARRGAPRGDDDLARPAHIVGRRRVRLVVAGDHVARGRRRRRRDRLPLVGTSHPGAACCRSAC